MLDGEHFLVSCPIDLFSRVTVELENQGPLDTPQDAPKAAAALRATLAFLGLSEQGARLSILSPIPRSKGMGSSTADVAGAIYAAAAAAGRALSPWEAAQLAIAVEPTNSTVFPDLALFDHRRGALHQELGPPPALDVLVLDCGGEVDTLAYNAADRGAMLRALSTEHEVALASLREGIRTGDAGLVGEAATRSARAHQTILPKPCLETALTLGRSLGAVGVCVGHSGTVIGVLFPSGAADHAMVSYRFRQDVPEMLLTGWHRLIGGGHYTDLHAVRP
jgi:L-threonine kinase